MEDSRLQIHLCRVSKAFGDDIGSDSIAPHTSLEPYLRYIDAESREDVQKFRFLRDARRCLLGRLLVRHVVSSRLQKEWSALEFRKSPRGRPHLVPDETLPAVDFNVTHDHDLVAVASYLPDRTELNCSVGVDVMKIENPWEGTATDELIEGLSEQLHQEELASLQNIGNPLLRLERILAIWTLKEAFIKATGDGLHFDLRRLNVHFGGAEPDVRQSFCPRVEVDGKELQHWQFQLQQVELGEGADAPYRLAIALHETKGGAPGECNLDATPTPLRFVELDPILSNAKSLP